MEKIHQQELSIPMNQVLTMKEAEEVVRVLNGFECVRTVEFDKVVV